MGRTVAPTSQSRWARTLHLYVKPELLAGPSPGVTQEAAERAPGGVVGRAWVLGSRRSGFNSQLPPP